MDINMEIKDIKFIIINFLKKIRNIFKDIRTLPNVWLYVLISIILTLFFLIFTFPYSSLIRNKMLSIGENIGRNVSIGKIDFGIISSTDIDGMSVILKDGSELALQNINLDIGIFSALINKSANGSIRINNIKYEKDKTSINVVAKTDFNLKFDSYSEFPASGKVTLDLQNVIANGISVKDFDIPPVRFTSIQADFSISRKKITIDNCTFSGPDLKGSIYGYINPAKLFQQSQINFNIVLDSSSSFLENYKILLTKWIDNANKIQLIIRGSISNPRVEPLEQKIDGNQRMELSESKFNKRQGINSTMRTRSNTPSSEMDLQSKANSLPDEQEE